MVFGPIDPIRFSSGMRPTFIHQLTWWVTFVPHLIEANQVHGAAGHELLADRLGIEFRLFQRFPAEDRHELVGRRAPLRGDGGEPDWRTEWLTCQ